MGLPKGLDAKITKLKIAEMKDVIICFNGFLGLVTMFTTSILIGKELGVCNPHLFALYTTSFIIGVSLYIYFSLKG